MAQELFNWLLQIPQSVAQFANWLVEPIHETYLNISPLALLGVSGFSVIITILAVHIIRLFIGG